MAIQNTTFNIFAMLRLCPGCNTDIADDQYQSARWFPQEKLTFWFPLCDDCLESGMIDMVAVAKRVTAFVNMGIALDNHREVASQNETETTSRNTRAF